MQLHLLHNLQLDWSRYWKYLLHLIWKSACEKIWETRRKLVLCLFFIVTKNLKKLLEVYSLRHALKLYNAVYLISQRDIKIKGGFSIPVRVTISTAHIWLNEADCGLFFLSKFRFVRYLSAISVICSGQLCFWCAVLCRKERKSPVHNICYSCLCVLEHMRIYIQSCTRNGRLLDFRVAEQSFIGYLLPFRYGT